MDPQPRLGLIVGEPAGIGPEIVVKLAQSARQSALLAFGDPLVLQQAAERLGLPLHLRQYDASNPLPCGAGELAIISNSTAVPVEPGQIDVRNAAHVIACLQDASRRCLAGELDGLVTAPVHKAVLSQSGKHFSGMTGFLAEQAGLTESDVVMMLANSTMRVALVTTHIALRNVAETIDATLLERVTRVLVARLTSDFGIVHPRIAVLGLNPHAGEAGHLGTEERDIIEPWLHSMRREGIDLVGPLPADTAFLPQRLKSFDAVLAMYHDQGLPVLKFSGFEQAVNISLGLPYVRVAVDHGTALDLAGQGIADPSSLHAALRYAETFVTQRRRHFA